VKGPRPTILLTTDALDDNLVINNIYRDFRTVRIGEFTLRPLDRYVPAIRRDCDAFGDRYWCVSDS
jgi:hypothetical protein